MAHLTKRFNLQRQLPAWIPIMIGFPLVLISMVIILSLIPLFLSTNHADLTLTTAKESDVMSYSYASDVNLNDVQHRTLANVADIARQLETFMGLSLKTINIQNFQFNSADTNTRDDAEKSQSVLACNQWFPSKTLVRINIKMTVLYPLSCGLSKRCKENFLRFAQKRMAAIGSSFSLFLMFTDGWSIRITAVACNETTDRTTGALISSSTTTANEQQFTSTNMITATTITTIRMTTQATTTTTATLSTTMTTATTATLSTTMATATTATLSTTMATATTATLSTTMATATTATLSTTMATATTATTQPLASTLTSNPTLNTLTLFEEQALIRTNIARANHCASPLTINVNLTQIAQSYAQHLCNIQSLVHSTNTYQGQSLGENLWSISSSAYINQTAINGSSPINAWYNEVNSYNWQSPGFSAATGHFTQLVWRSTTSFGIGICCIATGTKCYVVANYFPAGNFNNQYSQNVQKPPCI